MLSIQPKKRRNFPWKSKKIKNHAALKIAVAKPAIVLLSPKPTEARGCHQEVLQIGYYWGWPFLDYFQGSSVISLPAGASVDFVTIFSYILKVSELEKIEEKIRKGEALKLKEAEAFLRNWGYIYRPGKGSHRNWKHPRKPKILTIAVHGKELPRYITRELKKLLEKK